MATSNSVLAAYDFKCREALGPLHMAWRLPKLFESVGGEALIKRQDVTGYLSTYGQQKRYDWPVEFSTSFPLSTGAAASVDYPEAGERPSLGIKRVFAELDADPMVRHIKTDVPNAPNPVDDKINRLIKYVLPVRGMFDFWLDGTDRLARIAKVSEDGKTIHLKPMWTQDAAPGCFDATKYIYQNMFVDVISYSEATETGAVVTGDTCKRVTGVHRGTVAYVNGSEDSAYITLATALSDTNVVGKFIALHNAARVVDGAPQGAMRWVGKGTNEDRGSSAAWPAAGHAVYATLDKSTAAYERFGARIYNEYHGTYAAEVTLTDAVLETWLNEYYDHSPYGAEKPLDVVVMNTYLRPAVHQAFADGNTLFFDNNPDGEIDALMGYRGVRFYDINQKRWIPLVFTNDAPRQTMWGFNLKVMLQADVNGIGEWAAGTNGIWTDMRPITFENIIRAVWEHDGFTVNHVPSTSTAIWFIDETPTFS